MGKKDKITIYTNETCSYCASIKTSLDKEKIKYTEVTTTEENKVWQNIVNLTGMPTVPTIHYKENYFVPGRDFNTPSHLVAIIKDFSACSFPNELQSLEKIKTLNYNISVAFKNLDKLLRQIETKLNIKDEHKSTD